MITRKRINNDIYIRWAIFSPDGTPVDLALATIKKIQARAKVDGSIYNLLYNKEGNFLNVEFPAANQKDYGIHNLYLEYTVEDASTETGFRTFTMDYNNAFELVPISCELLEPQSDPIVIQGIIASFTYSMLSNAEKNDLASRLGSGEPYINLTASSLLIKRNKAGVYTPSTVTISSRSNNTEISKWTVSANGAAAQEITEESSPYAEISLQDNIITIVADSSLKEYYTIRATDGILYDYVTVNTVKDGTDGTDGEDGVGTDGKNSSTGFVYRLSIEAPDTPTDKFIPPTGWSKNMPTPSGLQRVWLSTISIEENELVGAWSDPIPISGINGEDGEDGTDIEFIYRLTTKYEAPELPESIQDDVYEESEDYVPEQEYIPEFWTDSPLGISAEAQFEWVCVRYKKKGIWTAYQGPTLWSRWGVKGMDGDGVEYIFTRTMENTPPTLPANSKEDIEWPVSGWTDNPKGIDTLLKYEWVSIRKEYEDGWGNFSDPALWSAYGKEGQSSFKSTAFIRQDDAPGKPSGGDYLSPNPTTTGWSDGVPKGTEALWASTRIFTSDGKAPQQTEWTKPEIMSDSADFDVEFSSIEEATMPTGHPNTNPQWSNEATPESIWMATSTKKNGVWSAWSKSKIKGEDGKDGKEGEEGKHGMNTATIYLYKRYSNDDGKILMPNSDITYNFTTEELTGNKNGWAQKIFDGEEQLYVIGATASSRENTDIISPNEWSEAVKLGKDGFNSASISLYQRGDTIPLVPQGDCVYTFSTGALTNISQQGWSRTIPSGTSDKKQLYVTTATAISTEPTDIISNEEWADPAIMAEDGKAGIDGIAKFKSTVFIKSIGTPDIPTGGEWASPIPTSFPKWTDGVPTGDDPLYMSTRIFTDSGESPQQDVWTTPEMIGDTPNIDFEFSTVKTSPGNPTDNPSNWENTPYPDSIWMAVRTKVKGVWGAWKVTKIKGEDGEEGKDGINGDSTQTIYRRTSNSTPPNKPATSQEDFYIPTDWSLHYTGVTDVWTHEWVCTRTKTGGTWGEYEGPGIYAKYSEDGGPGQQGLAGCVVRTTEWALNIEYRNDEALVSDSTRWIDVVILINADGDFDVYKCISTHTSSEASKPGIGANWGEYWEKFNTLPPIYTPMIMAPNAVLRFTQSHELTIEDDEGNITAGMSGKDNIRFWAGGETPASAKIKIYASGDIEGENYYLRADGSGYLAGHNISWDADGKTTFRGEFRSTDSKNKVTITTQNNSSNIRGYNEADHEIFKLGFETLDDYTGWSHPGLSLFTRNNNSPLINYTKVSHNFGSLHFKAYGSNESDYNYSRIGIEGLNIIGKNKTVTIDPAGRRLGATNAVISIKGMPTSSSGLVAGDIWSDNGTLKIVK